MKDTNTNDIVRTEGGWINLPNPQTTKEYEDLILNPLPASAFQLSKETMNDMLANPEKHGFVSSGSIKINPVAKSLLEDEVKNATIDTLMKGTITLRNFR